MVVLLAARASRLENQDAIDAAIVNMLADPKEVTYLWAVYYLEKGKSIVPSIYLSCTERK